MQARPQCNLPVRRWRHWVDHEERELVVEQHRHTLCNCITDITNQLYYLANMRPSIGNRDSRADQSCFPYNDGGRKVCALEMLECQGMSPSMTADLQILHKIYLASSRFSLSITTNKQWSTWGASCVILSHYHKPWHHNFTNKITMLGCRHTNKKSYLVILLQVRFGLFFCPQNRQRWTATGLGLTQILRELNWTT